MFAVVRTPVCAVADTDTATDAELVGTEPAASPVRAVTPPAPAGGNTMVVAVVRTPVCAVGDTDIVRAPVVLVATEPAAVPRILAPGAPPALEANSCQLVVFPEGSPPDAGDV